VASDAVSPIVHSTFYYEAIRH